MRFFPSFNTFIEIGPLSTAGFIAAIRERLEKRLA